MEPALRDTTMLNVLLSLPTLIAEDPTLLPALASLPFVCTASGDLQVMSHSPYTPTLLISCIAEGLVIAA